MYLELVTATDADASEAAARLAAATLSGGGDTGQWRLLGEVEQRRPFFIEYDLARAARTEGWRRAYAEAAHDCTPGRMTFVEVGGEERRMRQWVDQIDVPLRFAGGEPRLARVGIATDHGEIVLR